MSEITTVRVKTGLIGESMRYIKKRVVGPFVIAALVASCGASNPTDTGSSGDPSSPPPSTGRWVSGYWVGYQRSQYPENQIDMSLLTHIIVGAMNPTSSGGVTTDFFIDATNGPLVAKTISARAHAAGRKAILMLGGSGQLGNYQGATSAANINKFVTNLVTTMDNLGYDGIDVDWEPVNDADKPAALSLLQKLRAARPTMIITMPITWVGYNQAADPWYAQVAAIVDQMNIMSYEMAGAWSGWVSWHSAALYGQGADHPSSISGNITQYTKLGIPASRIGIGLGFYGDCWRGPTAPLQAVGSGVVSGDNTMTYANIMASYYTAAAYHWDANARMGYLSFATQTGPQGCTFVSYEDEASIAEKGAYVKSAGVGGAIIWTINQGRIASAPAGSQDPLLKAAYNSITQ
jgi:chitinase